MALQLRSLLCRNSSSPSPSSAFRPKMIQYGTLHNLPSSSLPCSLPCSLFGQGGRSGKPDQCRVTSFSSNLRNSYCHWTPIKFSSQLRIQTIYSTAQTLEVGKHPSLNLMAHDLIWRSFSANSRRNFQFKLKAKEGGSDGAALGDKKTKHSFLAGTGFRDSQDTTLSKCNSVSGRINATVPNAGPPVKRGTEKVIKPVGETGKDAGGKEKLIEDSREMKGAAQSHRKVTISYAYSSIRKGTVKASKSLSSAENDTESKEKVIEDSMKKKGAALNHINASRASSFFVKGASKASQAVTEAVNNAVSKERVIEYNMENKEAPESSGKIQSAKTLGKRKQKHSNKKKNGVLSVEGWSSSSLSVDGRSSKIISKENNKRITGATHTSQIDRLDSPLTGTKIGNTQFRPLYPPSGKSVVVVESVTKAKVIQNYLGDMYEVLPSYGHVRDLAGRSRSVRPDDDFSMVWEVPASAWTHLKSIKVALRGAENLILASDPDREGEAVAWHISEMLQQQDALNKNVTVVRVVFNEITESSIKSALQAPREIDRDLVNGYLARRALDYLIGFNISPLLWKKLPGCQSAGQVQSTALALVCDRETEIEKFNHREYWTVGAEWHNATTDNLKNKASITSHLTHFNSKKLDQFSICSHALAQDIEKRAFSSNFKVISSKSSKHMKNPPMPYMTSTLQQDSANRLHFTAAYTMKVAQKLYEGVKLSVEETTGLITYMRTDGLQISNEAAEDIRSLVKERYGVKSASKTIRRYFRKVKNAQEAHEAIRPTNIRRLPATLKEILDEDSLKLYTLIWTRTMACQMEPVMINMIQIDIGNVEGDMAFRSVASKVGFSGFQAVYKDREAGVDEIEDKEEDVNDLVFEVLCNLKVKASLSLAKVDLRQHHTTPPPRYSEGTLVKKLEQLGIGKPSTYASILKVLQDRNYITVKDRLLHPEFRGRMVSAYITHHFSDVADYRFTADMETELDKVSSGETEWKGLLRDYWSKFSQCCNLASKTDICQVERMLEEKFGHILFTSLEGGNRVCPSCSVGTLRFKVSKFGTGYFVGCDRHPKCKYIAATFYTEEDEGVPSSEKLEKSFPPKLLGYSPGSNEKVFLKNGPYGYYVQLGDDRQGYSPKRASVPEVKNIESMTVEYAIEMLQYPKTLGNHPEDEHPVLLRHSKFGFTIKHRRTIAPVPKNMDPKKITLEVGVKLLSSKSAKKSGRPKKQLKPEVDLWE